MMWSSAKQSEEKEESRATSLPPLRARMGSLRRIKEAIALSGHNRRARAARSFRRANAIARREPEIECDEISAVVAYEDVGHFRDEENANQ